LTYPITVIWDFNGTLLNDAALTAASISKLLRRRHLPELDIATHRRIFGFPVSGYYQRAGFDLSTERLTDLSDEFHKEYLAGVADCSLNPGVLELLESFQRANVTQFVLSAAEQSLLETWVTLHRIDPFFTAVYGLTDRLAKSKTDRGIELFSTHAIDPAQTLFIGDTDHDAAVAEELGAHSVVVLQGHQDLTCFDGHDGDIYDSFDELERALHTGSMMDRSTP
jgi:phosphoglycolate phosphatase